MAVMDIDYRFHAFRLLPKQRLLLNGGPPVKLGSRAFDMLLLLLLVLVLVERRERVVTKHQLMDLVWPQLVVEENNLQVHVLALRKLLGHGAIATVPGRGYRFTLPVQAPGGTPSGAASAPVAEPIAVNAGNLHGQPPELFGRDDELQELQGLIDSHAVVTVTGAGDIGKTRLAQGAAARASQSCNQCRHDLPRPEERPAANRHMITRDAAPRGQAAVCSHPSVTNL